MTGNRDWLLPAGYHRRDAFTENRCTEHGSVQDGTQGAVGTLIHLLQMILVHACRIRCDRCAFYADAVLADRIGRINGDLIVGFIPLGKTEVIIFCVQVDIRC